MTCIFPGPELTMAHQFDRNAGGKKKPFIPPFATICDHDQRISVLRGAIGSPRVAINLIRILGLHQQKLRPSESLPIEQLNQLHQRISIGRLHHETHNRMHSQKLSSGHQPNQILLSNRALLPGCEAPSLSESVPCVCGKESRVNTIRNKIRDIIILRTTIPDDVPLPEENQRFVACKICTGQVAAAWIRTGRRRGDTPLLSPNNVPGL